jgi:uncharacterized BrkB/YihY/UPF0761 family membrane protein
MGRQSMKTVFNFVVGYIALVVILRVWLFAFEHIHDICEFALRAGAIYAVWVLYNWLKNRRTAKLRRHIVG